MRQPTAPTANDAVTLAEVTTEISTRIAALSETLKVAVKNENDPAKLNEILNSLRSTRDTDHPMNPSPERAEFSVAYDGRYSKLEVRPGVHGMREVQFTLRGGLDNLKAACDEINNALKAASNYPKHGFQVFLSENNDLPEGQDVTVTYTPVIRDSGVRVRFGTDRAKSHSALLSVLDLEFVNNDLHRLACGAFRVKEGFPTDLAQLGTVHDTGDLNEGKVVRTEKGPRSSVVATLSKGVDNYGWNDGSARLDLAVAGAVRRN